MNGAALRVWAPRAERVDLVLGDDAFPMVPERGGWFQGEDATGDGRALNVRALSKRCPHLGCRPNPCLEDFWIHCPCHQSRYDRLGTKVDGVR